MSIPHATAEQLASQHRLRARAAAIELERSVPFSRLDAVLTEYPVLADMAAAGLVVHEGIRWSA